MEFFNWESLYTQEQTAAPRKHLKRPVYRVLEVGQEQPGKVFALAMTQKNRMVSAGPQARQHAKVAPRFRLADPYGVNKVIASEVRGTGERQHASARGKQLDCE